MRVLKCCEDKEITRVGNRFFVKKWYTVKQRYLFVFWAEIQAFDSVELRDSWLSALGEIHNLRIIK